MNIAWWHRFSAPKSQERAARLRTTPFDALGVGDELARAGGMVHQDARGAGAASRGEAAFTSWGSGRRCELRTPRLTSRASSPAASCPAGDPRARAAASGATARSNSCGVLCYELCTTVAGDRAGRAGGAGAPPPGLL